jgi:hypothetical protein
LVRSERKGCRTEGKGGPLKKKKRDARLRNLAEGDIEVTIQIGDRVGT